LAMEEQFYLIWPSVERFMRASLVLPTLLLLIFINQLCNFGVFANVLTSIYGSGGPIRPIFMITFTPILLGVLAAHAMHDPKVGQAVSRLLANRWIPALLLAAVVLVCEFSSQLQGLTRLLVHVLFCLMLLSMVINPRGIFSGFLQSRVMFYLGSISYGIYLYHTFVLWAISRSFEMRGLMLRPVGLFLIAAPIAIALAAMSFRYFEKPIMNLRKRMTAAKNIPIVQ